MISTLHQKLVEKELSCVELTNLYLEAAQRDNAALNAYVTLTPDAALAAARAADERLARGESLGLLDGIPMTLKDNISTKGLKRPALPACSRAIARFTMPLFGRPCRRRARFTGQNEHGRIRDGFFQ